MSFDKVFRALVIEQVRYLRDEAGSNRMAAEDAYGNAFRVRAFYNSNRTFLAERGHVINGNPATQSWLSLMAAALRYANEAKAYTKLADDIENLYKDINNGP